MMISSNKTIGRALLMLGVTVSIVACGDVLWSRELHVEVSVDSYPQCARVALAKVPIEKIDKYFEKTDIVDFVIPLGATTEMLAGRIQRDTSSGLRITAFGKGSSEPENIRIILEPILQSISSELVLACGAERPAEGFSGSGK
jgi:hypothetical protein